MMSFYEFQRQFPDDEACLQRIMIERYGGTELDCPKCGEHGKFYRMTRERAYVCQHCKHQLHPDRRYADGALADALAQVVLRDVSVHHDAARRPQRKSCNASWT